MLDIITFYIILVETAIATIAELSCLLAIRASLLLVEDVLTVLTELLCHSELTTLVESISHIFRDSVVSDSSHSSAFASAYLFSPNIYNAEAIICDIISIH